MPLDLEKFRSIRLGGRTKGKAKLRTLTESGKVHGYEIEYQDGRQEAVVRPEPLRAKFSISRGEADG